MRKHEALGQTAAHLVGDARVVHADVLDEKRHAGERSVLGTVGERIVGHFIDRADDGVELGIDGIDGGTGGVRELLGGHFARGDQRGQPDAVVNSIFRKLHGVSFGLRR